MKGELPGTMIQELIGLERLQAGLDDGPQKERIRAIQIAEARRILGRKDLDSEIHAALLGMLKAGNGLELDAVALGRTVAVARVFARARMAAGEGRS